ncbi:hypothetical protein [Streptomyces sp. NPDC087859]|uniref:hypothetical protein n=1 Tax=Streptomyces sp. NPDC087859 TaxID=3365812 RepID=UPI0038280348
MELDYWDWGTGENFVLKMNAALERGRLLALFPGVLRTRTVHDAGVDGGGGDAGEDHPRAHRPGGSTGDPARRRLRGP